MFGNIQDLIFRVDKLGDSPIQYNIGEKSPNDLHKAIYTEFWKEVIKRKQISPYTTLNLPKLGVFDIHMSHLKKFIFTSIRKLRRMRIKMKEALEANPSLVKEELKLFITHDLLVEKVRIAWQQLELKRKVIIIRTIAWNQKLRDRGEEERIIANYKPSDYSFVEYFAEHKKLPPIE